MTVFSFPYLEDRARNGTIVYRPAAVIDIQGIDGEWHTFCLYADAGADITLLRRSDCEMLGLELESGELRHMGGVCSGLIQTFIHSISLRLGTVEFPCRVAFADRQEVPRLLGRLDVFSRFKVCYDEVARVTEFHLRKETE